MFRRAADPLSIGIECLGNCRQRHDGIDLMDNAYLSIRFERDEFGVFDFLNSSLTKRFFHVLFRNQRSAALALICLALLGQRRSFAFQESRPPCTS
jgi:hypothetical protein